MFRSPIHCPADKALKVLFGDNAVSINVDSSVAHLAFRHYIFRAGFSYQGKGRFIDIAAFSISRDTLSCPWMYSDRPDVRMSCPRLRGNRSA